MESDQLLKQILSNQEQILARLDQIQARQEQDDFWDCEDAANKFNRSPRTMQDKKNKAGFGGRSHLTKDEWLRVMNPAKRNRKYFK
jgi:hypothetical protein